MKYLRFTVLSIGLLGLSACQQTWDGLVQDVQSINIPKIGSASQGNSQTAQLGFTGTCPAAEAVSELKSLTEFSNTLDQTPSNIVSSIEIGSLQSACSYDENTVTIDLSMNFNAALGPRGRTSDSARPFFSYPFFVAVTSANGKILAKEVFAASLTYDPGQNNQTYTEKLRQIIPIEDQSNGGRYKVLVGFQLTPDQLAHNRKTQLLQDAAAITPSTFEQQTKAAGEQASKDFSIGKPIQITP